MIERQTIERPSTLAEVAAWATDLESFGRNLRDWQHEVRRRPISSRPAFQKCLAEPPPVLAGHFASGAIADAYLAAYAEWLADRAGLPRPAWVAAPNRVSPEPWFSSPARARLLVNTPASFRQRNLFAIPEPVFAPRRGRPAVSEARKREKARLRQQAYRDRLKARQTSRS